MKENISWKNSFFSSPGPRSWYDSLKLFIKGIAMGSADIVPGVSGGTVAFITGIYEQLMNAIKSIDLKFVKFLLKFELKKALAHIHIRFLLLLLCGIVIAIISVARLITYLLLVYPEHVWSLFFGLILASIVLIGLKIKRVLSSGGLGLIIGASLAYFIVGLIPFNTPNDDWFIFLSGLIAISAMILPGISGAFILLLLGKYEFMVHALKNPFTFENQIIIVVFLSGCVVGIMMFARIFSYLFRKYHNLAIAILTGFVVGSLRKIWPWKEVIETEMINNELHIISEKNILPNIDTTFFIEMLIIVIGFSFVLFLGTRAKKEKTMDA